MSRQAFIHALYDLASNTEYVPELRQEVESIIREQGWTKAAIDRMNKLDSFLRESQRVHGIGSSEFPLTSCSCPINLSAYCLLVILSRKAVKDFRFSDGTFLPTGTLISLPMYATHRDEANYSTPDVFDPFRFSRVREGCESDFNAAKYQMISSGTENLTWGLGRHVWYACLFRGGDSGSHRSYLHSPGRYFAAVELKAMLAHILVTYDIKMPKEGERPRDIWLASVCIPSRTAKVLFRKRPDYNGDLD
jgi:cytochrome P450